MKKGYLYIILAVFSLIACTKVINVDLGNQIENRLVVNATLVHHTNEPNNGYQEILLSRSQQYFDDIYGDHAVSGAVVSVVNNNTGQLFLFNESQEKGKYITNDFIAMVGHYYTLEIQATLEGELQTFIGEDSIIATPPEIDSVILVGELDFESGDTLYDVTINADNPSTHDYFKFETYIDDSLIINENGGKNFFFSLIDDAFLGAKITEFKINDRAIDPKVEIPNYDLKVKMKRLSFQSYNFLRKLYSNASSGDDTAQTQVKGCIKNITYPERYPLGTFITASESEKTVEITRYP